jgi:hypothetical protein
MELIESRSVRRVFQRPEVRVFPRRRVERPGLEGAVCFKVQNEETVHDVICRWSERGSTDPWDDVIAECVREAFSVGVIREVHGAGSGLMKLLGHHVGLEPGCGRITARWSRFEGLVSSCRSSIA